MSLVKIEDMLECMDFTDKCDERKYDKVKIRFDSLHEVNGIETKQRSLSLEDEDEKLLLEIVRWMQDKKSISNNQLKHHFEMGYERANRFLARLEKAGLISAQKRGAKLPRKIEQDEVKKYLKRYKDIAENELEEDINTDNTQLDRKLLQEQNIESIVEVTDIQGIEKKTMPVLSHSKPKQRIKIDPKLISENTSRYKNKKKPVH